MTRMKGTARLGFAAALLALLLAPLAFGFQSVSAQGIGHVATYYGTGLTAGDTVGASVDGVECGSVDADADGNWILPVNAGDDCAPEAGDTVNFSLNGEKAEQTETWTEGGGHPVRPGRHQPDRRGHGRARADGSGDGGHACADRGHGRARDGGNRQRRPRHERVQCAADGAGARLPRDRRHRRRPRVDPACELTLSPERQPAPLGQARRHR